MTAALICSVFFLGAGNLLQAAERWHMVNKVGDRLRLVNPPKAQGEQDAAAKTPAAGDKPLRSAS